MCYLSKHHRGLFEKIVYSRQTPNKDAYIQSLTCIKGILLGNLKVNVILYDRIVQEKCRNVGRRTFELSIIKWWYVRVIYITFFDSPLNA